MGTLDLDVGDVDLTRTLGSLEWLAGDPTIRVSPGRVERATLTPEGPGGLVVTWEGPRARVTTSGDGAGWLAERALALLGCADDVTGFAPSDPPLRDLWRRSSGDRIARTGTLWHDLAWLVVQQRVNRTDAAVQWRRLVTALGTPAPGLPELLVPPAPEVVGRLGYADFHRFGIERRRAEHLVAAAIAARATAPLVDGAFSDAEPALRSVRGLGPWTATCLAARTWGEADTVIVGDDGIPSLVAWVLAREIRADDARMLELLEPYRPHRYRVLRLVLAGGQRPPRRAPRGRRTDIRRR